MGVSVEGPTDEVRSAPVLFGRHLRRLRLQAGLTQEECAARLGCSIQHFGNLETGRRVPREPFVRDADRLLDGREVLHGLWRLARDQRLPGARGVGAAEVETVASAIHTYQAHLVPALLRQHAYARAVVASSRPPLRPAEAEARVHLLLARQQVLARADPPWFWAVVDEAVLCRELGSRDVMRAQLGYLVERLALHTVTVQVLPFASPITPAMGTSFTILSSAGHGDVVHTDSLAGAGVYGDAETVSRHRAVFDYLRESALSAADSLALIDRRRQELDRPVRSRARSRSRALAAPRRRPCS